MKFLLAALIAASIIFLFGCVQVSPPESCTSLSAADQPGCIYYTAVMNQDPYACYALQDTAQRTVCLKDAIDPTAKKALYKKTTVVVSGSLTNKSTGLSVPTVVPGTAPTKTLGKVTEPVKNATSQSGLGTPQNSS